MNAGKLLLHFHLWQLNVFEGGLVSNSQMLRGWNIDSSTQLAELEFVAESEFLQFVVLL
jgi:hypothetical protein